METLTNGIGREHWLELTKDWHISAYMPGSPPNRLTEGLSLMTTEEEGFTRQDFEQALKKVSRRKKSEKETS